MLIFGKKRPKIQKEEICFELAKYVANRIATCPPNGNSEKKEQLSEAELDINAKAVMEIKSFKELAYELQDDIFDIDKDVFFDKFMEKMSDKCAAASEKTL